MKRSEFKSSKDSFITRLWEQLKSVSLPSALSEFKTFASEVAERISTFLESADDATTSPTLGDDMSKGLHGLLTRLNSGRIQSSAQLSRSVRGLANKLVRVLP